MAKILARTAAAKSECVLDIIARAESTMAKALPKGISYQSLVAGLSMEVRRNPELLNCDPTSIFWAFVHAAELGLSVSPAHQEAHIVTYRSAKNDTVKAQLILGYRGLEKLAYQHPAVIAVDAHSVYENDRFEYDLGTKPFICFSPSLQNRGELVGAFAKVLLNKNGVEQWLLEVLGRPELDGVRSRAPGSHKPGSPWNTDFGAMCRKTAIRRILNRVPRSSEVDAQLRRETYAEIGEDEVFPMEVPEAVGKPALADAINDAAAQLVQEKKA